MSGATHAIDLFEDLIELPSDERRARLAALEGRDPETAERVRRMLAADAGEPLAREQLFASIMTGLDEGARVGPYRVLRELGRGGMGTVYLAERSDGAFDRTVAIKVVRALGAGDEVLRRLDRERRLLARLEHPGIVRILDGGVTGRGEPYLVMEHVDGEPIDRYCDRLAVPVRARLELFLEVCEAVRYAHRALIVHRDLKPENILVDRQGRPRLLDFGIGKLIDSDAQSTLTRAGGLPFTPSYASPEQILGKPVSTASDVYSLGVVLYQLLAGETPFEVATTAPGDLVRSAESRRAELPSRRVARLDAETASRRAERRGTHPRHLERQLAGDLDRIVAKAIDPDPEQRYASVDRFREDLRRHLHGLPVSARPATLGYRTRKFVRRNRLLVAAATLITMLVVGGAGVALWQRGLALEAQARAEREAARARGTSRFLVSLFQAAGVRPWVDRQHKGPQTPIIDVLEEASRRLDEDVTIGDVERADLHQALGDSFLSLRIMDQAAGHFERTLELRRAALGELHEDTARAWYFAAYVAPSLQQAITRGRRSVAIEERLERPSTNYPYALADLSGWLIRAGRLDDAEIVLERARGAVRGLPDDDLARYNVLSRELMLAFATGAHERLEKLIEQGEEQWPGASNGGLFDTWRGRLALRRGREHEAADLLRAVWHRQRAENKPYDDAPFLVIALSRTGAVDEAARIAETLPRPSAGEPVRYRHVASLVALASVALASGRPEACERSASAAVEALERETVRPTLELAETRAMLDECRRALRLP